MFNPKTNLSIDSPVFGIFIFTPFPNYPGLAKDMGVTEDKTLVRGKSGWSTLAHND